MPDYQQTDVNFVSQNTQQGELPSVVLSPTLDPQTSKILTDKIAIPYTTTQPTFTPSEGTRRIYFDGTNYFYYVYVNGAWRSFALAITPQFLDSSLETGLLAYWKLEDLTENYIGGGTYDLTNNNSVVFSTGKILNAADGGAANTNKNLITSNFLSIDGGTISVSCWVNITTQITSGSYTFFQQQRSASQTGYRIAYSYNGGTKILVWEREKQGSSSATVSETIALTPGTWYHLVLTYDGTDVYGWRDGVNKGSTGGSGDGTTGAGNGISILAQINASSFTSGLVDEVGVWNKRLSNAEIANLYNAGSGLPLS